MLHIQSSADLKLAMPRLSRPIYDAAAQEFKELAYASGLDPGDDGIVLDGCRLAVVEATDRPETFFPLLNGWPEYSQLLATGEDGLHVWKIVYLADNDCIEIYLTPKGHHPALDELATRYLESSNEYGNVRQGDV